MKKKRKGNGLIFWTNLRNWSKKPEKEKIFASSLIKRSNKSVEISIFINKMNKNKGKNNTGKNMSMRRKQNRE